MSLSPQETQFLTHFAASGNRLIHFTDAEEYLHSRTTAVNTLSRLARKGWLQRLERGLYLIIPLEAGPERIWSENAFIIGSHLVTPGAIAYWSAFRFWNWTEQLPNVVLIQTPKRKRPVTIQGMEYRFITIAPRRFFGTVARNLEGAEIRVTDREKTLIDALDRPDLCGGIQQIARALKASAETIEWVKLDRYLDRWGGGTTVKRLGYLVEALSIPVPDGMLHRWQQLLTKGISPLEPGAPNQGRVVTRWQIRANVTL